MMKYLVILLSDQSTSFCYYNPNNNLINSSLMPLDTLKNAIKYAFMEDMLIQFVLPPFPLPKDYEKIVLSTQSSLIAPASSIYSADVLVIEGYSEFKNIKTICEANYVLRIKKDDLFKHHEEIIGRLVEFSRLNIVVVNVEEFTSRDFEVYGNVLNDFAKNVKDIILTGASCQLNILTDRLVIDEMNNCNAGNNTITLAPNGLFYICPAFYYANEPSVGSLDEGLIIRNKQLYKLEYAPLCRGCDAYQCKRCVFLNTKLTKEVNVPSREQCIMSHIERNASRSLLLSLREYTDYMSKIDIKEITYLDPFDNIKSR